MTEDPLAVPPVATPEPESSVEESASPTAKVSLVKAERAEAEDAEAEDAETEDAETEPEVTPRGRPHVFRRRTAAAVLVAAALFVGGAGFAAASVQPYLVDRATVDTKVRVATTAAEALTTLWTYTPEDVDSLPARAGKYLVGDFAEQFRGLMGSVVPETKQAQVSKRTEVVGTAVESLTDTEATVVVYANTTDSSPLNNNVAAKSYWSYRVALERHGGDWLVTKMTTITKLSLTPLL